MTKEAVLNSLKELPDEFELEELLERLLSIQRVQEAREQVRRGETVSETEARQRLAKWLQ